METTTNNQNSKISLPEFSFFRAPIINVKPYKSINIVEAYYYIRGRYAIAQTDALRTLNDIKERRTFKAARFDYCTFSGVFTTRNDNALVRHSGLLCLDFDHLHDVEATAIKLLGDDYFETQLLFLFVTAQASAGKGRLSLCRRLVEPVHRQLRDINKLEYSAYKRDQAEYVANKNNPDIEPPVEHAARVFQMLPTDNASLTNVCQAKNILLNALPSSFDRPTYLQTASRIGIPASTADKQIRRYIAQGLLVKEGTKVYVKIG